MERGLPCGIPRIICVVPFNLRQWKANRRVLFQTTDLAIYADRTSSFVTRTIPPLCTLYELYNVVKPIYIREQLPSTSMLL